MTIVSLSVVHLRLPLGRFRVSLNSPSRGEMLDVLLVTLETDLKLTGVGFTYFVGPGVQAAKTLIETDLAPLLIGENPQHSEQLFAKVQQHFRQSEFAGLVARAYAPIDIGLWDLKAKAQDLPLWELLGASRSTATGFISDLGLMSVDIAEVPKAIKPHLDHGAMGLLIEIGSGDVEADASRIHDLRHAIGESSWLGVTAGGRFDLTTALGLAEYLQEEMEVDWFEQPIPMADRLGYDRLADRLEVPLVLGASLAKREDFLPFVQAGIPRILRADLCRLGGITPWLKVAALAEIYHLPIYPVRLPEVGLHLACGLTNVPAVDYVSWLNPLFKEALKFSKGVLHAPQSPGLGIEIDEKALAKLRVSG